MAHNPWRTRSGALFSPGSPLERSSVPSGCILGPIQHCQRGRMAQHELFPPRARRFTCTVTHGAFGSSCWTLPHVLQTTPKRSGGLVCENRTPVLPPAPRSQTKLPPPSPNNCTFILGAVGEHGSRDGARVGPNPYPVLFYYSWCSPAGVIPSTVPTPSPAPPFLGRYIN
jgi:hypothetical protein